MMTMSSYDHEMHDWLSLQREKIYKIEFMEFADKLVLVSI